MANDIAHFAVHADDCERAKRFYEQVFGWRFEPWGPPNFWQIETSPGAPVRGALQQRKTPAADGQGMTGFECTISVDDISATVAAITSAGGQITLEPFTIPTVGTMIQFRDTEGNAVAAMQYDAST